MADDRLAEIEGHHDDCSDDWCAYFHTPGQQECDVLWLLARCRLLEAELDAAQLRSIEARNPGIDMDEVRRRRGVHSLPVAPPESVSTGLPPEDFDG